MSTGVAATIKRKGGLLIEEEAMRQGPIEVGEAVLTPGGNLIARHVIHAAVMGQDLRTSADAIERATRNTLARADDIGARTVALPAFGTGVGGFPIERCATIMVGVARAYRGPIEEIVFALRGDEAMRAFETELA